MSTIAIVDIDRNYGIGKNGTIPWKTDLAFFNKMTTNHVVIMGKNTWESLSDKPLLDRINIVVSTKLDDGRWKLKKNLCGYFYTVKSLGQALRLADDIAHDKEHFIIGGEHLYLSAFVAGIVDAVLVTKYADRKSVV